MSLTCECDLDGLDYYYESPEDYSTLKTSRRKRCVSCKDLININSTVVTFYCYRSPRTLIEEDIYGDEVPRASKHMCEECGDLFFSLKELGFCIMLERDNMKDLVKEYAEIYGNKE